MSFSDKFIALDHLPAWRDNQRRLGHKVVVTNGCFDILHLGHVTYLESARKQGDLLLVGVNGDAGVKALKGEGRPVNQELDRALVLTALESVSAAAIFPESRAIRFLQLARPDVYVKGGDYTVETLNPDEREVLLACGSKIVFIPFVAGKSTTTLLEKIVRL